MGGGGDKGPSDQSASIEAAHFAFTRFDEGYHKVNEATVQSGTLAVRSAFILNGGATLALLAFAANTLTSEVLPANRESLVLQIMAALPWFAWGAFLSAITTGVAFLSNRLMIWSISTRTLHYAPPFVREGKSTKRLLSFAFVLQVVAILATVASLVAFLLGLLGIAGAIPTDL